MLDDSAAFGDAIADAVTISIEFAVRDKVPGAILDALRGPDCYCQSDTRGHVHVTPERVAWHLHRTIRSGTTD